MLILSSRQWPRWIAMVLYLGAHLLVEQACFFAAALEQPHGLENHAPAIQSSGSNGYSYNEHEGGEAEFLQSSAFFGEPWQYLIDDYAPGGATSFLGITNSEYDFSSNVMAYGGFDFTQLKPGDKLKNIPAATFDWTTDKEYIQDKVHRRKAEAKCILPPPGTLIMQTYSLTRKHFARDHDKTGITRDDADEARSLLVVGKADASSDQGFTLFKVKEVIVSAVPIEPTTNGRKVPTVSQSGNQDRISIEVVDNSRSGWKYSVEYQFPNVPNVERVTRLGFVTLWSLRRDWCNWMLIRVAGLVDDQPENCKNSDAESQVEAPPPQVVEPEAEAEGHAHAEAKLPQAADPATATPNDPEHEDGAQEEAQVADPKQQPAPRAEEVATGGENRVPAVETSSADGAPAAPQEPPVPEAAPQVAEGMVGATAVTQKGNQDETEMATKAGQEHAARVGSKGGAGKSSCTSCN